MVAILMNAVSRAACNILVQFPSSFFFSIQVVQPYSSTDTATAWKNCCFILSVRLDFYMVINLSLAIHTLPMHILTSLSADEILWSRYTNSSTYFRGLLISKEMAPSFLKHLNSIWSEFMLRLMPLAAYSKLWKLGVHWIQIS